MSGTGNDDHDEHAPTGAAAAFAFAAFLIALGFIIGVAVTVAVLT